jgi:hypothetical protein
MTQGIKPLPSIEEFADKTGVPLRRVIKGALLRLAPEFRTPKYGVNFFSGKTAAAPFASQLVKI